MSRTHDERLRLAEARVVRAAVRRYEAWMNLQGDGSVWNLWGHAVIEDERAVRALLKERGRK